MNFFRRNQPDPIPEPEGVYPVAMPYRWEAWVGQRIARCETDPDTNRTTIVLDDGRGATFTADGYWFMEKDAPHKHVFDSDLGEQATYFGHLLCSCGKSLIYKVPVGGA
jgi:hypothetical protein